MELLFVALNVIQNIAISLGVGASTLAIVNFFVAIADGKIDETERKMMGITYIILRVAMLTILIATVGLLLMQLEIIKGIVPTSFIYYQLILIGTLFTNAILMTKRLMPSTFGPAIQAGSWYTLGILTALEPFGLTSFSLVQFLLIYASIVIFGVSVVNGMMAYLKSLRTKTSTTTS